ncbi:MAG: hypothetical protein KJP04_01680, partial [Arenicella sp.]|nr:hypothetical protein [Arenicella sp.]
FQVPVVYQPGHEDSIQLIFADGSRQSIVGHQLDQAVSKGLFARSGRVRQIDCYFSAHEDAGDD